MSIALMGLQQRFLAAMLDDARLDGIDAPPDGVEFYRASVASNLRAALASTYPVVERLGGAAFFAEAARVYARAHPSAAGDLGRFGGEFAGFIEGYAAAQPLPYLADVARLEWAIYECRHAADVRPFDFATLAAVAEAQRGSLRVRPAPGVRLVRSDWPVLAIWEANQPGRDLITPSSSTR